MDIVTENFSSDHGVFTYVGSPNDATFTFANGRCTASKLTTSWATGGIFCNVHKPLAIGDTFTFRWVPVTNRVGLPSNSDVTFYKLGLAVDATTNFFIETYGVYIQGGNLWLQNGPLSVYDFGSLQVGKKYTISLEITPEDTIRVNANGPNFPDWLGDIPGPYIGRLGTFVANMYSIDTLRFEHFSIKSS